jgi:hypothetical protein
VYIQDALENWQKKMCKDGIGDIGYNIFNVIADDQLIIAQDYEDLEYTTRKLIEEYEVWGLKLNV